MKCIILDDYQGVALDLAPWSSLGGVTVEAENSHIQDQDRLASRLAGAAIVVAMRERTAFDSALFARLPDLKLLVTTGMRNAAIDLDAATRHGVTVCGTRGAGNPTVEITWALILMTMRRLLPETDSFRNGGPWQSTLGRSIEGRTIGIIGLGRVGSQVAQIARAFGMDVLAFSPSLTAADADSKGARLAASLDDLLRQSDVVSLHVRLNAQTHGMIGPRQLSLMKPHAVLINSCRGPVVDERALLAALHAGTIGGAGLDVYAQEPLPLDHPYRTAPNLVCTPHLGYVSHENYAAHFDDAVENIEEWQRGSPVRVLYGR